jgi:hypothetical protein
MNATVLTLLTFISAEGHTSLQIVRYALLPLTFQDDNSNTLRHGDWSDKERVLLADEFTNSQNKLKFPRRKTPQHNRKALISSPK